MGISVYNIYAIALMMAIGAAILSGIILTRTFSNQQSEREQAQHDTGIGQAEAIQSLILAQLTRMQTNSDGNLQEFLLKTTQLTKASFDSDVVMGQINQTIFYDWVPQVHAVNQLNGFGLTLLYPAGTTNVSFDRTIQVYADGLMDGSRQYMWTCTFPEDDLLHAFKTDWVNKEGILIPTVGEEEYAYGWFDYVKENFQQDNFFDIAMPWAGSDGNSYWYFTHQRTFLLHGIHGILQTWDDAITWRNKMLTVRVPNSEFVIFDSNGKLLATTNKDEADRITKCRAKFEKGAVTTGCIDFVASEHPIPELQMIFRLLLDDDQWNDTTADPVPFEARKFFLNGTAYMGIIGTLFSHDKLRMTVVWYQPWARQTGNIMGISALVCCLTVLSTAALTVMGIFGILRPLMTIGRGMRCVASSLRDGNTETMAKIRDPSFFSEVDQIGQDFETIVVDFLGFSSAVVRDNKYAPKDDTKPFAIIFTDIESSTGLWGADPVAMSRSVQAHHEIVRKLIAEHRLYEVKTVGDSFMVAATSAACAIKFAVQLQIAFYDHDWDWEDANEFYLLSHKDDGTTPQEDLWNGLRVRVGIHYGLGDIIYDAVTKGYDYYGTVVNTAARIEAAAHGGQILVSEKVLDGLVNPVDTTSFVATSLGKYPLRGVLDPPALVQLLPSELMERRFPPLRLDNVSEEVEPLSDKAVDYASYHSAHHSDIATPKGSVLRYHNLNVTADDIARCHSLVKTGAFPVEYISRQLQQIGSIVEDMLLPLAVQQRLGALKVVFNGWGLSPPHSEREIPTSILQVAHRMIETPKALIRLRKDFMRPNPLESQMMTYDLRQGTYFGDDLGYRSAM